jgi:hypothetical protein
MPGRPPARRWTCRQSWKRLFTFFPGKQFMYVYDYLSGGLAFLFRNIAQELSLSSYTIDAHRKNMKKKLHARNTAELITSAFARKII